MWSNRFIMIHPERTGGTVLTDAFSVLPNVSKEIYKHKHARASIAKQIIGDTIWNSKDNIKICLYRDEDSRNNSWYYHIIQSYETINNTTVLGADDDWINFVKSHAKMSRIEFDMCCRLPPVSWYNDTKEFMLLTAKEAYNILVSITRYDPGIVVY